jgi:hypothetical protein
MKIFNFDTEEHYTQIWLWLIGLSLGAIVFWPVDFIRNKLNPPLPPPVYQDLSHIKIDPRNTRPTIKFHK